MEKSNESSVFDLIGGRRAVHIVVEDFYDLVLADPLLAPFFKNANMDTQRGKMKAFLMMALGGPIQFTGKEIRYAHTHLVMDGLTDEHFDATGHYLDDVLETHGVSLEIREVIGNVFESYRKQVLDR